MKSPLSAVGGILALNRVGILLVVSLIATWSIAHILPKYSGPVQTRLAEQLAKTRERIPSIKIDFHPNKDPRTAYNTTKLALLVEGRNIPTLVPQILHMISVVPPDWRFLFIGSNKSVVAVGRSFAIKYQQAAGKLDLMIAPKPFEIHDKEHVFRMMTDPRFYSELLPGVEYLLKYEADSIMCSNSDDSLDDWLHYDWAGAPRTADDHFGGNGGLSLRRVSTIQRVLSFQARQNNSQPEDEWFGKRLTTMEGLKVATGPDEQHFTVEDVYHEKPMGYHVRTVNGKLPEGVWKNQEQRKKIFEYCPEIAIIMPMKLERERCQGDNGEGVLPPEPTPAPASMETPAKESESKEDDGAKE